MCVTVRNPLPLGMGRLKENKKPTLIRFDLSLLRKVNEAARHRGISRSAWIQYIISKAIDNGDI